MKTQNSNLTQEIKEVASQEVAQELYKITTNFLKNQTIIKESIDALAKNLTVNKTLNNRGLTLVQGDFYVKYYSILNQVNSLVTGNSIEYLIGIVDPKTQTAYQVKLTEEQLLQYTNSIKSGLRLSRSLYNLIQSGQASELEVQEISNTYFQYRKVIQSFCTRAKKKYRFNNGYVFEGYGKFNQEIGDYSNSKISRAKMYQSYIDVHKHGYKFSTGGDLGNIQYKTITKTPSGNLSTSTIARKKTIDLLQQQLNYFLALADQSLKDRQTNLQDLILGLKKEFTQISEKISQSTLELAEEMVKEYLEKNYK